MSESKLYRFRINTAWEKSTERAVVMSAARKHYKGSFTTQCVNILISVLKPLSLALRGRSRIEVQSAIAEAEDKITSFFDLAVTLVEPSDLSQTARKPSTPIESIPEVLIQPEQEEEEEDNPFSDFFGD